MDNLNFIKIYFRIIIYKIIFAEKTGIILKKVQKIGIRIGNMSKCTTRRKKTLKRESKRHLNTKVRSALKSAIRHFWSAQRHFQIAEWHSFGLRPNFFRVTIRHILFDLFTEWCVPIRILSDVAYFLSTPTFTNRD